MTWLPPLEAVSVSYWIWTVFYVGIAALRSRRLRRGTGPSVERLNVAFAVVTGLGVSLVVVSWLRWLVTL